MYFTVKTEDFKTALFKASCILSDTTTTSDRPQVTFDIRPEEGETIGRTLYLHSNTLHHKITTHIDCTDYDEDLSTTTFKLTNTKLFTATIQHFEFSEIVFELTNNMLSVICGTRTIKQQVQYSCDTNLLTYDKNMIQNSFNYSNKSLKKRYDSLKPSLMSENARKVSLTDRPICFEEDFIYIQSPDCIVIDRDETLFVQNPFSIPATTLKYICNICNEDINITTTKTQLFIFDGTTTFVTDSLCNTTTKNIATICKTTEYSDGTMCINTNNFKQALGYLNAYTDPDTDFHSHIVCSNAILAVYTTDGTAREKLKTTDTAATLRFNEYTIRFNGHLLSALMQPSTEEDPFNDTYISFDERNHKLLLTFNNNPQYYIILNLN